MTSRRAGRSFASLVVLAAATPIAVACSSYDAPSPAGSHDASVDVYGGSQICDCCGTKVPWPASESCGQGACDGICNLPRDASADGDASCPLPAVNNDPRCPAHYAGIGANGTPCAPIGLTCAYPGEGDGSGCDAATAMMWCRGDAGADGRDAGGGAWTVAQ